MAIDFETADIFNDYALIPDPHPYFSYLRERGPVVRLPAYDVVAVVGWAEGCGVYADHANFSSIVTAKGPIPPLPFKPEGDDISAQLDAHRAEMPYAQMLVAMDPPAHTRTRLLLTGLLTPKRFKENEAFMTTLADRLIDGFVDKRKIEVIADYSHPFATLTIADLLGMPEESHAAILPLLGSLPGRLGGDEDVSANPLMQVGALFYQYLDERRREPRNDVMSILANAKFRDGSMPSVPELAGLAALLFGAGQDTTVRLIAAMLKTLGEHPELEGMLRENRELIPNFVEEVLRMDGPTKAVFRLALRRCEIGGVDIPAGTIVMLIQSAMNRDPRHFDDPHTFKVDRVNARDNVSFGRGVHACIGSPLARVEARLTMNKLLDRIVNVRIDDSMHGPESARTFEYEPNYTQRSLRNMHVTFDKLS